MKTSAPASFVTERPWQPPTHGGPRYGTDDTYWLAAGWLLDCQTVADWGGGYGYFGNFLHPAVRYTVIDGTRHADDQALADLAMYREPSDGILLRHVLDNAPDWRAVLENAVASFRQRLVVVTFTPDAPQTHIHREKSGWPIWHFNPDDIRAEMGRLLRMEDALQTSHPERVYYLERR